MRYHFHLRIGSKLSPDDIGLELPDLETAYLEAFEAAQAMWRELLAERSDPLLRSFEIADEHGQVLVTLPFKEVLDRAHRPSAPARLPATYRLIQTTLQRHQTLAASLRQQIELTRGTIETTRGTLARSRRQTALLI